MRRLFHVVVAVIGACSMLVLPAVSAQASDTPADARAGIQIGGNMQCTIYPYWTYPPVYSQYCTSPKPSYSSTIHFRVQTPSPSYTYTWSMTGATLPASCTSASSTCTIAVSTRGEDRYISAAVVVSDGSQTSGFTADAWALAACPGPTGVEFC